MIQNLVNTKNCFEMKESIGEAVEYASMYCFQEYEVIPDNLKSVFQNERIARNNPNENWGFAAALKKFVDAKGRLPIIGSIPPMKKTPIND
jgi:hypothetical protein